LGAAIAAELNRIKLKKLARRVHLFICMVAEYADGNPQGKESGHNPEKRGAKVGIVNFFNRCYCVRKSWPRTERNWGESR